MHRRLLFAVVFVSLLAAAFAATVLAGSDSRGARDRLRGEASGPSGFTPAATLASGTGRYFVTLDSPAVADAMRSARGRLSGRAQSQVAARARASQRGALAGARSLGGRINYRYDTLLNGFSTTLSADGAAALARRADVRSVEPVSIAVKTLESAVPFIGAPAVYKKFHDKGQGVHVAVVDDGIDYTHKNFNGPGTVAAYESNDPNYIERGSFPTRKVIGGYDFVGSGYDVLDDDTTNDTPHPDFDPLDDGGGHGSHTAGICCGKGVAGQIGAGVAPRAKILSYKVWSGGNTPGGGGSSTDDVLVAAYERAVDPNQDGNTKDKPDVLSFSGGVDYGTLNSAEARAAQRVVDLGTTFVASAGNSSNQNVGAAGYIVGTPAVARGVVAVAASIDQYTAQTLTVNSPPGLTLPDNGIMVEQEYGGMIPEGGLTGDLYDTRAQDPPASPGNESPSDAQLCDPVGGSPYTGKIVLVFKGSTSSGDCAGSQKVYNAQQAGAEAVVMISLFGGFPSALSSDGQPITIPAVMITADDGYVLLDELSPSPPAYNTGAVNITLESDVTPIPGFEDSLTDFTSEGPARLTSDLKPDISAPGFDIKSTAAGTGTKGVKFSGTSMAAPMVSGVAALLKQIHPGWDPGRIKAVLMNQATRNVASNDLSKPAPATVMGAGRVRADQSAKAVTVAEPGSLSYGLRYLPGTRSLTRSFKVSNTDRRKHSYKVKGNVRYSDFDPAIATIRVSTNGSSFASSKRFKVGKRSARRVYVKLTLDPAAISEADQLDGFYVFNPTVDGTVRVKQRGHRRDRINVAWQTTPLAASQDGIADEELDLSGGPATTTMTTGGSGVDYGDLYLLGDEDPLGSRGEEDIVATGARSFTGTSVEDDVAAGLPDGTDELAGLSWTEFLTNDDEPTETVEFGVQDAAIHNTAETLQTDVLVDAGADGVFADPDLQADYLVTKAPGPGSGGVVCVYDLSDSDPLDECDATYFQDYSSYNANVTGLAVDARAIGLSDAQPELSYSVTQCTDAFSGDVPTPICDTAGAIDPDTGTYDATLNATDPALRIDPLVCQGFWDGGACDEGDPITVDVGSAAPDENPSILALFPNNAPSRTPTIISTTQGP